MYFKVFVLLLSVGFNLYANQRITDIKYGDLRHTYLEDRIENSFRNVMYNPKHINTFVKTYRLQGDFQQFDAHFDKKTGVLQFNIKENSVVQSISIHCPEVKKERLIMGLKTSVGKMFNYHAIQDDIHYINNYLQVKGFVLASVREVTISDHGDLVIDIEFPTVKSIQFLGVKDTNPMVLYRELHTQKTKGVRQDILELDYLAVSSLPYYSSISLPQFQYISSEDIRIMYRVKEKKVNRFDFGLEELEKDQGLALFSRVHLHHVLIYSDFLQIQAQLGYLNQFDFRTYKVHYRQPWLLNRYHFEMDLGVYTSYRSELYQNDTTVYDTVRTGGRFFLVRPLKSLFLKAGAGVYSEAVYPQETSEFQRYKVNAVSIYLEYLKVKYPLNPKEGVKSRLSLERGGNVFGNTLGGVDFMRLSYFFTHYVPIHPSITLAYRFFGGYYKKSDTMDTFETEKFSLGGANTLRGYKELALFGNYRLSFNIEPRFHISKSLVGVVFLDAGYIVDSVSMMHVGNLRTGYGAGLRFLKTFLPIRLDLAYGNDLMMHLSIAHTF
jgi:outer membrane protein insertion porin family